MPYSAPGVRVKKKNGIVGTPAVVGLVHGAPVNIQGIKGVAAKSGQVDRWTLPTAAGAIAGGEEFVVEVGGVHEILMAGGVASLALGDYIEVSAAGVVSKGTPGTITANTLGVVQEIDTSRTPNVARVNCNLP
jgi:hypothetical protein